MRQRGGQGPEAVRVIGGAVASPGGFTPGRLPPLEGSDETIAASRQRLDVTRRVGLITERDPDLLDAEVQPLVEVDEGVAAPDLAAQLFAGHDVAGAAHEEGEDLEGLLLELDEQAALAQLAVAQVDLEDSEADDRRLDGSAGDGAHRRLRGHLVS